MSGQSMGRRVDVEIAFEGVDISSSIQPYLKSVTYVDNEADEADDLQIVLQDRDGLWMEEWLNNAIDAAASEPQIAQSSPDGAASGTVTPKIGLNVRAGTGTQYEKLGALPCGSTVQAVRIENGWAQINYKGRTAYVAAAYLRMNGGTQPAARAVDAAPEEPRAAAGSRVELKNAPFYYSSTAGTPSVYKSGTFYFYDGLLVRGRYRITNRADRCGKLPVGQNVTGWVPAEFCGAGMGETEAGEGVPSTGLCMEAVIIRRNWNGDGRDEILDCGSFELDSVDCNGPPAEVTIKGTSLPFRAQIRQTIKSRSWETCRLSEIAAEMADKNRMVCMFLSGNDPFYERVEQYRTSDVAFLKRLCDNAGISLNVSGKMLVMFDQKEYEKKAVVVEFKKARGAYSGGKHEQSYISYSLSVGTADTQYQSCRVSYTDPRTGACVEGIARIPDYDEKSEKNQQLEITANVSSVEQARKLAEKRLRLHNKYCRTAEFVVTGNPNLAAGETVRLTGWGGWDGRYIIRQAKHTVSSDGYTTTVSLRRVLEGY